MDALATAIIRTAAFIELSSDDAIDPDAAVRALGDIAGALENCTPQEQEAIRSALPNFIAEAQRTLNGEAQQNAIAFYNDFMDSFGVGEVGAE